MKRNLVLVFLAFLGLLLVGCAKEASTNIFRFEIHQLELERGDARELLITGNFGKDAEIVYTVENNKNEENKDILQLIEGDRLTVVGLTEGTTQVVATVKNNEKLRAVANVTVIPPKASSVTIKRPDNFNDTMKIGDRVKFGAIVTPTDAGGVKWSTSDPSKAMIDNEGFLTAIGGGLIEVRATSLDGNITSKILVNIAYNPVTSVSLEIIKNDSEAAGPDNMNVAYLRESIQLKATVYPKSADPFITWTSSNENVANVDNNGNVFGVGVGTATIKATSVDGKNYAETTLTFSYAPVEGIELKVEDTINIIAGQDYKLSAVVYPTNANPNLEWQVISGNNINKYDPITKQMMPYALTLSGSNVAGLYNGKVNVIVKSVAEETIYQTVTINVLDRPNPTNIEVSTPNADLRQIVDFSSADSGAGVEGMPYWNYYPNMTVSAKVVPALAHQDLEFVISDPSKAIIELIDENPITGETFAKLVILQPGEFTVTVKSKYSDYYTELEPVVKKVKITEKIHEFDFTDPEIAENVTVGGVDYKSFHTGDLINFEYGLLEALYGSDINWDVRLGEGGSTNGVILSDDQEVYYILKPGTYYIDAYYEGTVVHSVTVKAIQEISE